MNPLQNLPVVLDTPLYSCTTTAAAMFLSQVWKRGWSVKGVSSPDDVMAVEVPKYGTFKLVAHELALPMGG